jgi:predicted outer membrane protein
MKVLRSLIAASLSGMALSGMALLGMALLGAAPAAMAQGAGTSGAPAQTRSIEPQEFLRLAYSSASLQGQAAKLAASRETRPEVKSFAAAAVELRTGLLQRIEAFSRERNLPLPSVKEFEHQVILENLEPLDYLALSRRYAEIQIQALEQELGIYQAAARSGSDEIKAFAAQVLPELQKHLVDAQKMFEAVKP